MSSVKRGKWERQNKPNPIDTPPPPPEVSTQMVADGKDIVRGNSNQIPLSPQGQQEVQDTGAKLAAKGGLDDVKSAGSARGEATAQAIAAQNPKPIKAGLDGDTESWALGNLEGQEKTPTVKAQIDDLVRKNPSYKIPGQGAVSNRPGESFDDFRTSRLSAIRGTMSELADNPQAKLGRITHSQTIKLVRGWLDKNTPDDLSVNPEAMKDSDKSEEPGTVARLFPDDKGKWKLTEVNLDDQKPLDPGVYLIRHGMTPWNKETYEKANGQQDAIAEITKHTKGMNWKGVRDAAEKAGTGGHLSDDQISDAVDAALPEPEKAAKLPLHRLMAVAAAASPEKRQQYAPLIQNYPGLDTLHEYDRSDIADHLKLIGLG